MQMSRGKVYIKGTYKAGYVEKNKKKAGKPLDKLERWDTYYLLKTHGLI